MSDKPAVRVAFETYQFFEIDIPDGVTDYEQMCEWMEENDTGLRQACADLIISGMIDFRIERMFDEDGNEV